MADAARLLSHASLLYPRAGGVNPSPEILLAWPLPNYVNPEERGWEAPIVLLVFIGITFLIFLARVWARLMISKNAGLDDILISIAMLPLLGLTISAVLGKTNGCSTMALLIIPSYKSVRLPMARMGSDRSYPCNKSRSKIHLPSDRPRLTNFPGYHVGRIELPCLDLVHQDINPLFLSAHDWILEERVPLRSLGRNRVLHAIHRHLRLFNCLHMQSGYWILPLIRSLLEDTERGHLQRRRRYRCRVRYHRHDSGSLHLPATRPVDLESQDA
jgi:hypothetical protein